MPSPLRARRAVLAVVAAAVVPVVASCGSDRGAAATVGDESLSVSELQDEVVELRDAYGAEAVGDTGELMRERVRTFILSSLVDQVAADEGVSVTGREVSEVIDGAVGAAGGRAEFLEANLLTEESLERAARFQVQVNQLGERLGGDQGITEAVFAVQEDVDVSVAPRYGTWDAENLQVLDTRGSIAVAPLEDALDTELAPE